MEDEMIERYRTPTRVLHWIHAGAFTLLFLTGIILYVSPLAILAQDGWTRIIHRAAAIVFIAAPLIYVFFNFKSAMRGVKDAFKWGLDDLGWAKAAPRYYFLADEKAMPPQGHMNTGQKMWWLMTLTFSCIFIVSGLIMWVAKTSAPAAVLQWSVIAHDIAFIATGCMFFLHIYLSAIHPLMRPLRSGAWNSMARGQVSTEYAGSHHAKWYAEVTSGKIAAKSIKPKWQKGYR